MRSSNGNPSSEIAIPSACECGTFNRLCQRTSQIGSQHAMGRVRRGSLRCLASSLAQATIPVMDTSVEYP